MMPFQNGHIIFKKPLVNNFRVAYVDTNCYSPPSAFSTTVHSPVQSSVRPKFGFGIGNRNQGPISVSVSEPIFFFRNDFFFQIFSCFSAS